MSRLVFTIIIPVQSYDHSVALSVVLSIVLGNHFTIGLLLIISQYLSIYLSTGQNFTHGYFDNKLLENDSYCRQDKLWSNRRERAGGQSLGHPLDVCPVLVWGYKGKET